MVLHRLIAAESYSLAFERFVSKLYATSVGTHSTRIAEKTVEIQQQRLANTAVISLCVKPYTCKEQSRARSTRQEREKEGPFARFRHSLKLYLGGSRNLSPVVLLRDISDLNMGTVYEVAKEIDGEYEEDHGR